MDIEDFESKDVVIKNNQCFIKLNKNLIRADERLIILFAALKNSIENHNEERIKNYKKLIVEGYPEVAEQISF